MNQQQSFRSRRIAESIHHQLALLLKRSVRDPRFASMNITEVKVSSDKRHADIYFTLLGKHDIQETLVALKKATGYLRSSVAKIVALRFMPDLHFHYDDTILRAERVTNLIQRAQREHTPNDNESTED